MQLILTENDVNNPIVKRTVAAFFGDEPVGGHEHIVVTGREQDQVGLGVETNNDAPFDVDTDEVKYDANGTPWDPRIHSDTHTFTKDGVWRRRRNLDDYTFNSVMLELASSNRPVTTGVEPTVQSGAIDAEISCLCEEQNRDLAESVVEDNVEFGGELPADAIEWPHFLGEYPGDDGVIDLCSQWIYGKIASGCALDKVLEVCNYYGAKNLLQLDKSNVIAIVTAINGL